MRFSKTLQNLLRVLNILVLAGSIAILVILSLEMLNNLEPYDSLLFMRVQLWVCIVFLLDFVVRFIASERKGRFLWRNLFFLVVSIPFLNIAQYFDLQMSDTLYYFAKAMPLIRGAYGIGIIVGWITKTKIATLFISYVIIILAFTYFSSIVFFITEKGVNAEVHTFWNAVCWACMNVTTVGSNIVAQRVPGQILAVLLPTAGMVLFPIFTAYVTTTFQSKLFRKPEPTETDEK